MSVGNKGHNGNVIFLELTEERSPQACIVINFGLGYLSYLWAQNRVTQVFRLHLSLGVREQGSTRYPRNLEER